MIRPYVCVACEKVIFDQGVVASLIGLFSKIIINVPAGTGEFPGNAVAPKEWAVFSSWDIDEGDELIEFMFCLQLFYPDKTQFGETSKNKMKVEAGKRSQVTANMLGFPVGQLGSYTVRSWVEANDKIVAGPIEFEIQVEIKMQEQAESGIAAPSQVP